MKKIIFTLFGILTLVGCKERQKSNETFSQEEMTAEVSEKEHSEIKIIPIEHASAIVEWKDITIYIDPTGGASAYKDQKQPDLILITDIHGDHFNLETIEALNMEKAKIVAPQAVSDKIPDHLATQVEVLNNGESKEIHSIAIEAIPMYNLREEALQFHVKGRGNGYVINLGAERIYFSGDTEDIPEMRALKNIDKAFVCMNLPYTMKVESAADAVLEFKPKQVYPYHFRGNPDVGDVVRFKELVNSGDKEIQLDWYPKEEY